VQLVAAQHLGLALRFVREALQKEPTSKMFKFGLIALEQFAGRLNEWPMYDAV
jgi:CCR4-NOT transcription complex subunit 1